MSKRLAVIDLGTNTFHLLIVDVSADNQSWKEIYRQRIFVHLAEEGIQQIGKAAFERATNTLAVYQKKCAFYKVNQALAVGTAALRTANNGPDFLESANTFFSYPIKIIPGEQEAKLIAGGVNLAVPSNSPFQLIMDIGGGSVEFILKRNKSIIWSKSLPIGVAVLKKQFHQKEPISKREIKTLGAFLVDQFSELKTELDNCKDEIDLVGASGTFDVLEDILPTLSADNFHSQLDLSSFESLFTAVTNATFEERIAMEGVPEQRASLIVVAFQLISHVLRLRSFKNLYVSKYALKEGVLAEMMSKLN